MANKSKNNKQTNERKSRTVEQRQIRSITSQVTKRLAQTQIQRISGQGGYYTDTVLPYLQRNIPKGTFARAGNAAGRFLGGATPVPGGAMAGGSIGSWLGGKLAQITGFGDYTVRSNTISTQGGKLPEGYEVPTFASASHETRVLHREYIMDVLAPSDPTVFSNQTFAINAGNSKLFPWLSTVSARYQQFRFNGLIFEFKTLSSDITAGGALGAVIMATNYDSVAKPFINKMQMENTEYTISAKPSLTQVHAVECDPELTASKLLYVRDASQGSATSDDRFYDLGVFQIATSGLPSSPGVVLGELWASYDITLLKPDLSTPMPSGCQVILGSLGLNKSQVWGPAAIYVGAELTTAATNTITFLYEGQFSVCLEMDGTVLVAPTITGTATSTQYTTLALASGTCNKVSFSYAVVVTAKNQTFVIDATGSYAIANFAADVITTSYISSLI